MHRRLALVALWVVFAAASVGVGFAAAGLVGDPFTDPQSAGVSAVTAESTAAPETTSEPTATATSERPGHRKHTRTAAPGSSRPAAGKPTSTTSRPHASATTKAPSRTSSGSRRTITTYAGLVSGTCRGGLVSLSASPAIGWSIDEISQGAQEEGQVKFRRTGGRDGELEVHARCSGGTPTFGTDHREGSGSGSGGDD